MPVQPADVRQGMINIRSGDDATPEEVLDQMTPDQAAQVGLSNDASSLRKAFLLSTSIMSACMQKAWLHG